jgi:hypothetical protein
MAEDMKSDTVGIGILRGSTGTLEQPLQRSCRCQFQVGRDDFPVGDRPFVSGDRNLSRNILEKILLARKDKLYWRSTHLICDPPGLAKGAQKLQFCILCIIVRLNLAS